MRRSAAAACVVAAMALPALARAQATSTHTPPIERTWEIAPYVGVARHSPAGTHLGQEPGRNHVFFGIHLTAALLRARGFTLAFAPEIVPLLLVSDNPTYHVVQVHASETDLFNEPVADGAGTVAGFGGSPIGFEGRLHAGPRVRLYIATAAGFLVFTRNTPDPFARKFNYSFEIGGGFDYRLPSAWTVRLGYKFHHFSNGNSALSNPGVDAEVVMIGLARGIGRR
jgi:hypothetical protein